MKWTAEHFVEVAKAKACSVMSVEPWFLDFIASLNIPDHHQSNAAHLNEWETRAFEQCELLILAKKLKRVKAEKNDEADIFAILINDVEVKAAECIGLIVAGELLKNNYKAPRIITEGLLNLQNNKPFKVKSGRKSSGEWALVLHAFYYLKSSGVDRPSQSEVAARLSKNGVIIKADRLSKIFDALKLTPLSSDARGVRDGSGASQSEAKARKRGKG
jgi:hypothetical protein